MRTIAFLSDQGGAGKSTVCINIGAALAQHFNQRVLIVDLDSWAYATQTLLRDRILVEQTVAAAIAGRQPWGWVIWSTEVTGLNVVPGHFWLRRIKAMLVPAGASDRRVDEQGRVTEVALAIEFGGLARDAFDYLLLDCPRGGQFMERCARLACDEVAMPMSVSFYDFYGLRPTVALTKSARQVRNSNFPKFLGCLPNQVGRAGVSAEALDVLEKFNAPLFTPVRASATMRTAPGHDRIVRRLLVLARSTMPVAASPMPAAHAVQTRPGMQGGRSVGLKPELFAKIHGNQLANG